MAVPQSGGQTGVAFSNWAAHVERLYANPATRYELTENDKARLVVELTMFQPGYSTMAPYAHAQRIVQELVGIDDERLAAITRLTGLEDVRTAVRYVARPAPPRRGDDRVYPSTGWFSDYLDTHAHMEVPLAWNFWSAVALVAAMCRRNFMLHMGNHKLWPNQYVMLVGKTGQKKSTAIEQAKAVLDVANEILDDWGQQQMPAIAATVHIHYGRGSPEGFCDGIEIQKTTRATARGIELVARTDSTAVVLNDELVSILGDGQPGARRWIELLTTLYGSPKGWKETLRGGGEREYANVAITTLFGSTIEWLRACTPETAEGGFTARFMFCHRHWDPREDGMYPIADIVDPVRVHALATEVASLSMAEAGETQLSADALKWYEAWYYKHRVNEPDNWLLSGWHMRKGAHMFKLATLLGLMSRPRTSTLAVEHLEQALAIIENEEKRLPGFFDNLASVPEAVNLDRMVAVLRSLGGTCPVSDLYKRCHRFAGTKRLMDELLAAGEATGVLTVTTNFATGGRPSRVVSLTR